MTAPVKRLMIVWAAMMGLTLAALVLGHARGNERLALWVIGALLVLSFAKAALLLNDYLALQHAPSWNKGLRAAIFALLALIGALAVMA